MKSRVAKQAESALLESMQRLSPEERLNAFLAHCQLMMSLRQAGEQQRTKRPTRSA
jgi:hypothetical protein